MSDQIERILREIEKGIIEVEEGDSFLLKYPTDLPDALMSVLKFSCSEFWQNINILYY